MAILSLGVSFTIANGFWVVTYNTCAESASVSSEVMSLYSTHVQPVQAYIAFKDHVSL